LQVHQSDVSIGSLSVDQPTANSRRETLTATATFRTMPDKLKIGSRPIHVPLPRVPGQPGALADVFVDAEFYNFTPLSPASGKHMQTLQ
jgi:hypothetical protein